MFQTGYDGTLLTLTYILLSNDILLSNVKQIHNDLIYLDNPNLKCKS